MEITAVTTHITAAVSYPVGNCSVTRVVTVMRYVGNNCSDYMDYCCSELPGGYLHETPGVVTVMSYLGNNCIDYTD